LRISLRFESSIWGQAPQAVSHARIENFKPLGW
jgi:hypothetical protein